MAIRLKGWLGPETEYWGKKVRWLWFKCPSTNPKLAPHNESIPVCEGGTFEARPGKPVWAIRIEGGVGHVSPSIDASASPCGFHDFYEFDLVSEEEALIKEPAP